MNPERGFFIMPILTHKDGWTGQQVVLFVGPDRSGVFPVEEKLAVPQALDPLHDNELTSFVSLEAPHDEREFVQLDYTDVSPENREQVLRVTGLQLYRKKFYLSHVGDGSSLGARPIPQPREHEYGIVSFARIRNANEYRRRRVYNNENTREVVGWITNEEHEARKGVER